MQCVCACACVRVREREGERERERAVHRLFWASNTTAPPWPRTTIAALRADDGSLDVMHSTRITSPGTGAAMVGRAQSLAQVVINLFLVNANHAVCATPWCRLCKDCAARVQAPNSGGKRCADRAVGRKGKLTHSAHPAICRKRRERESERAGGIYF